MAVCQCKRPWACRDDDDGTVSCLKCGKPFTAYYTRELCTFCTRRELRCDGTCVNLYVGLRKART